MFEIFTEKFSENVHYNFVSIAFTKKQQSFFEQILTDENRAANLNLFLNKPLKCIKLFQYFFEAGCEKICRFIENTEVFANKVIDLSNTKLSLIDIECLAFFFTHSSCKTWKILDLHGCHMGDYGFKKLHHGLKYCSNISVTKLSVSKNNITESSSHTIKEIVIMFEVKVLGIRYSENDGALHSILTDPSSKVEKLDISYTRLSN